MDGLTSIYKVNIMNTQSTSTHPMVYAAVALAVVLCIARMF